MTLTVSQRADALATVAHVMRSGLTADAVYIAEHGVTLLCNPISAAKWRATYGDSLPIGIGASAPLHITAVRAVGVAS
jgi:hypothetical protein